VGVAGVELPFDFFPYVARKLEIRFTDVAADDPFAVRLGFAYGGTNREGVLGVDQPHAISEEHHDVLLRDYISPWLESPEFSVTKSPEIKTFERYTLER
jgi:hypothetical protein